ncbi:zinc-dependent alcohol dehydrogenase family protein [Terriglobus saanensis]|uniref:Alcohol dehydrogenase zinc-binding domain protein n=1 Tax=Terriglobus saanensis (strain ATCC BAA-1853 / DSM 23119 / SP1PR4) TaxID=401053 RepID=E8UXL0_TERSS|nr:NAD(P)-dependent alcohol dehydrogenase [Terriglobus saanensis]ADV81954.1 Alcohol dehydrogenase zinc-binding domain protein [Terriglobus saanensis SP1PR4]
MGSQALRLSGAFGIENLTFDTVTVAAPSAGEVLVRLCAVSLNYRDLMIADGSYNPRIEKPRILGSDGAGEVIAVGSGVTSYIVGDRVVAGFMPAWIDGPPTLAGRLSAMGDGTDGVLATYRVFPAEALVPIPDAMTYEEASAFPCAGVTAWHALVSTGNVGKTDTVLALGTGGVSIFALQIAKMRGAQVLVTSSSDKKLELAKHLGANEGINYRTTPEWDKEVRRLTAKAGATHVIEVGGAGTLGLSIKSTRVGGQISLIGVLAGAAEPVSVVPILMNTLRIQGIHVGSVQMLREVISAFAEAKMKPVIDRVFPFRQTKEALHYLATGAHLGKVIVQMAGSAIEEV